jgi:glutamyl-Q tRNA(Asp) synthetase
MSYIGRFAPSPSGPLHFGSLVAALGSYFQAKSQGGKWLVRMEDLDPPREVAGAAALILRTLDTYQLHWDEDILYQSKRHHRYQEFLDQWLSNNQAYFCQCTRKQIKAMGGTYNGHCSMRYHNAVDSAVRIKMTHPVLEFNDLKHGLISIPSALANEDFIIKRRDGLFAYNLAVVIDDIDQGITEVVRGADLIEPTGRQISLYHTLNQPPVSYLHLPLATMADGLKLSKQNHAPAIDLNKVKPTLIQAMIFLGFNLPKDIEQGSIDEILQWGINSWTIAQLSSATEITITF